MARVWLAPVGTLAPTTVDEVMPTGWVDVGLFTPDSLGWSTEPSFDEVRSHQSNYPTRRFQTQDAANAEVDLQEWSAANFQAVFGGGTVTEVQDAMSMPTGTFKFTPPAVGGRTETAAILEIIDGAKKYRRVIPRSQQNAGVAQTFNKTKESTLPLRLAVLGSDVADPFYDLTNDASFDPAAA